MKAREGIRLLFMILVLVAIWAGIASAQRTSPGAVTDTETTLGDEAARRATAPTIMRLLWDAKEITIPLGILSFLGILLIVYYTLTLRENRLIQKEFLRKVYDLTEDGNFEGAQALCEKVHGVLPRVLAAGLRRREMGILAVSEGMASVGTRDMDRYRQRIRYLSDIAQVSPMLGLLGTVWGMIWAFNRVHVEGQGMINAEHLAGSVSYALITTAAGLMVAIPAMIAYYVFRGRLVRIGAGVEERASEFAERIFKVRPKQRNQDFSSSIPIGGEPKPPLSENP